MPALGEVEVARSQGVAHGERQRELPHPAIRSITTIEQCDAPRVRHELDRRVRWQLVEFSGYQLAGDVDRGKQRLRSAALCAKRQREEPWQLPLEVRVPCS